MPVAGDCANFEAPAGWNPNDPQGVAHWQRSLEVPLMSVNLISMVTGELINLFGSGTVSFTLGTDQARIFESEHVCG